MYGMMTAIGFLLEILTVFLLTIILMDNVYALRINEIEANPEGEDSGFEWIELYSQEEINLEGYILDHEGRGAQINLSGIFTGFFIIDLQNQWLRNNNETVYLKLNNEVIESIGPFTDNKKNKTYNFCEDGWKFISSSKNSQNSCSSENTPTNNNQVNNVEEEVEEIEINKEAPIGQEQLTKKQEVNEIKKISLAKKDDSFSEVTKTYRTRVGVVYFFIGFCIFIIVLISLKKL